MRLKKADAVPKKAGVNNLAWSDFQLDPPSQPPETLQGLSVDDAVEAMKQWFFKNFEDPTHNTPYDNEEGQFKYIWGGPYVAEEVIIDAFGKLASQPMIDAVVEAIESKGHEWAPNYKRIREWIDFDYPDEPFRIFSESLEQTMDMLKKLGSDDGDSIINRMVFAQQVSVLEAYLGDTLLKVVLADKGAMERLVKSDKYLKDEKFTLVDIIETPNILEYKVNAYLRSISYHDLKRVNFLYRSALGVNVLKEKEFNKQLLEAITYRHDCVHRNGKDKDDNQLDVFTKSYVKDIAVAFRDLVDNIEAQLSSRIKDDIEHSLNLDEFSF